MYSKSEAHLLLMARDHGGWLGLHNGLAFKLCCTFICIVFLSCLVMWLEPLTSKDRDSLKLTVKTASPPPPKPVSDGSSLFLTKRSESHGCCPISGLPWDARVENGTVPRPKKMAFMIGAQKAGTSFMFDQLVNRHRMIKSQRKPLPSREVVKEAHYFDRVYMSDFSTFVDLFSHQQDSQATYLDATPDYMHIPSAACRIADAFPDAKFVILLKDPVQRALSGWNMVRFKGKTTGDQASIGSFAAEVREEIQLLRGFGCSYESQQGGLLASITASTQKSEADKLEDPKGAARAEEIKREVVSRKSLLSSSESNTNTSLPTTTTTITASSPQAHRQPQVNTILSQRRHRKSKERGSDDDRMGANAGPFQKGWRMVRKAAEGIITSRSLRLNSTISSAPNSLTTSWIVSPDPASQPYRPWKMPQSLPSWNECFVCTFSYCSAYNNDPPGPPGTCRQDLGRGAVRRGLYAYQLEWWLRHFKPEQLLIVNNEEVKADFEKAFDRIVAFLGQDPGIKRNATAKEIKYKFGYKTPYSDLSFSAEDTMAINELYRYYHKPNEDLYRLLESLPPSSTYGWFDPPSLSSSSEGSIASLVNQLVGSGKPSTTQTSDGVTAPLAAATATAGRLGGVAEERKANKRVVHPEQRFPTSFSKARVSHSQAMLFGGA